MLSALLTAHTFGSPWVLPAATDLSVKALRTPDEQWLSLASLQEATGTHCTEAGGSSILSMAGPSSHVHSDCTFAAVHGRLYIRHSVLLGSNAYFFFLIHIKGFLLFYFLPFFFFSIAFAMQHQGCVPAGLRCVDLIVWRALGL